MAFSRTRFRTAMQKPGNCPARIQLVQSRAAAILLYYALIYQVIFGKNAFLCF